MITGKKSLAPILELVPQRPPFLMVSRLVYFDPTETIIEYDVPLRGHLINANILSEAGIMEHMAQSCAAHIGYRDREKPVKIGVIGAISKFELIRRIMTPSTISTIITEMAEVGDMLMVEARTYDNTGMLAAKCQLKISLID